MRFRRGDIVWARVLFPKKWWPGLVRSIDGHRVAVSFFNDGEDHRVFLETEVTSFEENFESLSKTLKECSRGEELLGCAVRLFAGRAAYGLKCPCHFRPPVSGVKFSKRLQGDAFLPEKLLSLVRGLAVSAFVEDSDFVSTVTMASQIHVFRSYLVADRKVSSDSNSKATKEGIPNFALPITGACSVAQSSEVSKLGSESLNGDITAPPEFYPSNPTESLGLKRHYDHSVESDIRFKLRKTMPLPSISGIHVDAERNEIGRTRGLESLISMPSLSDLSLKFCSRMPLSSYNCTDSVVTLDASSSMLQAAQRSETAIQMDRNRDNHNVPFENDKQDDFNAASSSLKKLLPLLTSDVSSSVALEAQQSGNSIQMDHSRRNHSISVEDGRQDGINEAFSLRESSVKTFLLPQVTTDAQSSVPQEAPQLENAIQMDHSRDNHDISFENGRQDGINTNASSSMPQEAPRSENAIQMHPSRSNRNISFKNSRQDCINEPSITRKSSMKKCLLPLVTSDGSTSVPLETPPSENAIQTDRSRDNHNISVGTGRLKGYMEEKPKLDKQSPLPPYENFHFLYMTFPKDSSLPSKKDLVGKFSGFGEINLYRTQVFERLRSAQVVFLHHFDALAAYKYAKTKKSLFAGAPVHFWVNPLEKKRNQSKFVVAPLPKLKPCLKNPYSGGQEDEKRPRKVHFPMQP